MTCGRPSRARASAHSATSTNSHDDGSGISEAWKLAPNSGSKLARGFDRFYGFLQGETDQFRPELVQDNHCIEPPRTPEQGYHLTEDQVDRAFGFAHDHVSAVPDRPFFTYLAFGACHSPHQAPADFLAKYRGRFYEGWDVMRARWFECQEQLGIVPADTALPPRNPGVKA